MGDQENGHQNSDEDARKLFLGGLPHSATKTDIEDLFGKYGEVEMCTIKTDQYTGRSRGFGFLIYKNVESVNEVLNASPHVLHDKKIDAKLATPQAGDRQKEKSTKVFVGGLDPSTTKDVLQESFLNDGTVTDVYLPVDKDTGVGKGFAFVTFDSYETAERLIANGTYSIEGKQLRHC